MRRRIYELILLVVGLVLVSCQQKSQDEVSLENLKSVELSDAKGFRIAMGDDGILLTILNPSDTSQILQEFILRDHTYEGKLQSNELRIPCQRIVCLSSTQLAYVIELDALDQIVGINSSRHLFNKKMKARVGSHAVAKVGKEGIFDAETIIGLRPDLIFVSPFKAGGYDVLQNLGIPLVPMAAYGEKTPLGRAEWMKMVALFTGNMKRADSLYNGIAEEYHRLKALTSNVDHRPTVMSGKMKAGVWYVPGGNSFYSHYFRDAGAEYIVKNDKVEATPMDYESVYKMAHNADYWRLLTSSAPGFNRDVLQAEDIRYSDFKSFETGNILLCNLREVPYREESCVKPHILLSDYVHHFHPELLPNYKPYFWKRIEQ